MKKHFLQKHDFLFVWNPNLIIYKENFLFVIISVKNRAFIQIKNLTKKTPLYIKFKKKNSSEKISSELCFLINGMQI